MITFHVIDEDINNARLEDELTHCVVANAARREFGTDRISCGFMYLTLNGVDYTLDDKTQKKIHMWTSGKKIRPFVVKMTKCAYQKV